MTGTLHAPTAVDVAPGRRLTRATRRGLALVLVLVVLEAGGLGLRYLTTDDRYVITDNAQVDGDLIGINAPDEGVVTGWRIDVGSPVVANQIVGWIELQNNPFKPKRAIRSPGRGRVARNSTTDGVYVTTGSRLAVAYDEGDTDGIYVTARVPEEKIGEVRPGAPVDILSDDPPGLTIAGVVSTTGAATAGAFSLDTGPGVDPLNRKQPIYPGSDTNPQNPQRVDQYVPVKILFTGDVDERVVPGLNVTVRIHRSSTGEEAP